MSEKQENNGKTLELETSKQISEKKCTNLENKIHELIAKETEKVQGMTVSEIQKALIRVSYYYNNQALEFQHNSTEENG